MGWLLLLVAVAVAGSFGWVQVSPASRIHTLEDVPGRPVALVLGAGLRPSGSPSLFLTRRLDAARRLYEDGKVRAVLVSGDSSRPGYDEPTAMRGWLVARGVPPSAVVRDFAGFDTHDTCVRARQVFGVDAAVVLTQDYHLRRALFSCTQAGIDAVGVSVSSSTDKPRNFVTYRLREGPAAVKAASDAALDTEPKHLGDYDPSVDEALAARH